MRFGLNLLYLVPGEVGGTEVYARELIRSLANLLRPQDFVVFVNRQSADWPLPAQMNRVVCGVDGRTRWQRYVYEQVAFPAVVRRAKVDVIHSLGYVAPLLVSVPSVVTVHDLNFQNLGPAMSRTKRLALRFFVSASVRRATRVITDSYASKRQLESTWAAAGHKVIVVHLGGDHRVRDLLENGQATQPPFFVAFSSESPHKNIGRLLSAYRSATEYGGLRHRLVVIGDLPEAERELASTLPGVQTTGRIGDSEVADILSKADYLVMPSTYEGFGLPVAEAMSFGVPSLLANRAALPEIGGDGALLFDPTNPAELSQLMVRVAGDPALRKRLASRALSRSTHFRWHDTARRTLAVYRESARLAR